jgi:two-component system LytT family response regulator
MKVLIIEDELLAAKRIRQMVEELDPSIQIAGTTDSISASVKWLQENAAPDLILMDIELADGQSFEIFNQTEVKSTIIFTTAYDEYAIRAFKVNSIDYLLKPIDAGELKAAFDKYRQNQEAVKLPQLDLSEIMKALGEKRATGFKQRFLVKQGQKLIPVDTREIAYFYTEDKISFIKTFAEQRYMVDHSLDELEGMLDPVQFFRANRQFILTTSSLDGIHHHFNGKLKVNLRPAAGTELFVSRERAGDFKKWLGEED